MSRLNKDTQPWVAREGCGFRFATGAGVTVVQMGGDGSCASKNEGGEVKPFDNVGDDFCQVGGCWLSVGGADDGKESDCFFLVTGLLTVVASKRDLWRIETPFSETFGHGPLLKLITDQRIALVAPCSVSEKKI
ncbi:hypothetical protein L1987_19482 [Smallanthus sonchifolius]|uniref:Uncharacterized protein n=1 Tax=Smallanthus sonchifolius TaxID=185202 RepID=A0ACB9IPF8_9ASTR|nr:hypothetical protein L1987_19482 [Smallanthus sonchifolius]